MPTQRVAIVGAGPGGLSAAMILAHRGYEVMVFEKEAEEGGRNRALRLGPYTFNTGPTFLMMTFILREIFEQAGKRLEDYLRIEPLDPMYRLSFSDRVIDHTADRQRMQAEIDRRFPGNEQGLERFFRQESVRFKRMYPCLQKSYADFGAMVSPTLMRALPHLSIGKSLYDVMARYFNDDRLITSFTFQSKYLGMSPWKCPGAFGLIPYVEHRHGIDYLRGGLCTISTAMARAARENGAAIHLSTPVRRIVTVGRRAIGVLLNNDEFVPADAVVINADFGTAMETLFEPGFIRKWTGSTLRRKTYSCSTFMLYLGLDKSYNEPHHHIIFADDYKSEIERIVDNRPTISDFSVYLNNASQIDPTLAPRGHSALYVLVPVSNQKSGIQWTTAEAKRFRDAIITRIKKRTSMKDIDRHIRAETYISPHGWEKDHNLFIGATFNLGHSLDQMLYFRPRNRFEEARRCYLVGGGTHPGSGLPTILESARISANLISKDLRR